MNVVFMGTPDFAVPIFKQLLIHHTVKAALTQPDRPVGRGQAVRFSPVKALALEAGVPVLQPDTLRRNADVRAALAAYEADVFVVAAYGMLLPPRVLAIPAFGCINVHASLLPKHRGAAPMQYALLNGDDTSGITIMHMAKGLDTGDIILQKALPIAPDERFPSLHDRMAKLGGECIIEALAQIAEGTATRTPQDDEAATFSPTLTKADGHIDWRYTSARIVNMTRALDPWPGPYALHEGQALKIWACEQAVSPALDVPGIVLAVDGTRGIMVKTSDGALWVTEVQASGGRRMKAADYLRGHTVAVGTVLN